MCGDVCSILFFFFNDTATTEIYTLSLHDALPICGAMSTPGIRTGGPWAAKAERAHLTTVPPGRPLLVVLICISLKADRKSTRLNSSHANISYAVFCLKKKNNNLHYT